MAGEETWIVGGRVLTMDARRRVFDPGAVAFSDGRIAFVGAFDEHLPPPGATTIDARGTWVLPGLVNAHTHSPMTVTRGIVDDVPLGAWLPVFAAEDGWADDDGYRASALLGCAEMLRNGVTTIADRYGPLDPEATPLQQSGIRAVVTTSVSDGGGAASQAAALDMMRALGSDRERRVHASLGPHATDTCSDELLRWVADEAERWGSQVYLHVAQSDEEVATAVARGYRDPVDLLANVGLLGPHVIAAHALRLGPEAVERLAATDTAVAHCPTSNARIEATVARALEMRAQGVRVGLGTDCAASNNAMDLIAEMKAACLLNKVAAGDPAAFTAEDALAAATIESARALALDDLVGSLEVGKRADAVVLERRHPALFPDHADAAAIVYAGSGRDVRDVVVDGEVVVRDRALLTVDVERAIADVQRARRDFPPHLQRDGHPKGDPGDSILAQRR